MNASSPTESINPLATSYDRVTIGLHWIVALAVLLAYGLGLVREAVPKGAGRDFVTMLHVSLGLTVLAGTFLRLAWRGTWGHGFHRRDGEGIMAPVAHAALYLGMIAIPVVGILMLWLKGRGVPLFGLYEIGSPLSANRTIAKLFEEGHELAAHGLLLLAGGHAAVALFHHYALGDGVLGRMIPGCGNSPSVAGAEKRGARNVMRLSHPEVHLIERIGWLRAAVLGANDGIISTASLMVGVASASTARMR